MSKMQEQPVESRPKLTFHLDSRDPLFGAVSVSGLSSDLLLHLKSERQPAARLRLAFHVFVTGSMDQEQALPAVAGTFHPLHDGLYFVPLFPFEPGLSYTATFNFSSVAEPNISEAIRLCFTPPTSASRAAAHVVSVFPSGDRLPENLLRFYIEFSAPMQRGFAEAHISVIDSHGRPADDVLYRPPLELWDREMKRLTVLLDPGRLKRAVGPNRALGPPLKTGAWYTLRIKRGIRDAQNQAVANDFDKIFYVSEAVRTPVSLAKWTLASPGAGTKDPLLIEFPRVMDHALALNSIAVKQEEGELVPGSVYLNRDERCWLFVPSGLWGAGHYVVQVSPDLEDVCGNNLQGAFDRPLATATVTGPGPQTEVPFTLA